MNIEGKHGQDSGPLPTFVFPERLGNSLKFLGPILLWYQSVGIGVTAVDEEILDNWFKFYGAKLDKTFELDQAMRNANISNYTSVKEIMDNRHVYDLFLGRSLIPVLENPPSDSRAYSYTERRRTEVIKKDRISHLGAFRLLQMNISGGNAFIRRVHSLMAENGTDPEVVADILNRRADELRFECLQRGDHLLLDSLSHDIILGHMLMKANIVTAIEPAMSLYADLFGQKSDEDIPDPPVEWRARQLQWYLFQQVLSGPSGGLDDPERAEKFSAILDTSSEPVQSIKDVLYKRALDMVNDASLRDESAAVGAVYTEIQEEIQDLARFDSESFSRLITGLKEDRVFIGSVATLVSSPLAGLGFLVASAAFITAGSVVLAHSLKARRERAEVLRSSPWSLVHTLSKELD